MSTNTPKKNSIILLQGIFHPSFYKKLKVAESSPVFVMEGRPSLAAGKAAVKALNQRGLAPTLIADNMAGFLFARGWVKEAWVAYQDLQDNAAIAHAGALVVGVLGYKHKIPVHLYPAGKKLRLLGEPEEVMHFGKTRLAPLGIQGFVPQCETLSKKYITRIHSLPKS